MIKVSVVVATYNSGAMLDRAVQSLLDQTLPTDEFEAIFVDDGSTDGTYPRLEQLAAEHPHFQTLQIPNSGWSGRPRNLGADRARGEYLLYLDHDDLLFPDALRRMYDYAAANGADVLLGKEVMKGDALTPGWPTWQQNVPATGVDQLVLHCVTPHKLYRRALIADAGIRFPEGPIRLEDQYFNAAVYAATDKIAILSDYPCYQWLIHDQNLHRAGFDFDVFLDSFYRSLEPIMALPEGRKRHELLKRWYVRVILRWLGPGDHPIRDRYLDDAERILSHFPISLDADLEPIDRIRSWLFRRGDRAGLDALRELDRTVKLGVDPVRTVDWDAGTLLVDVTGTVLAGDRPYPLRSADGRLGIDLSLAGLPDLPPDDVTAIDDRLGEARVDLGLRGRKSGVEWPMPDRAPLVVDEDLRLTFRVAARIALRDGRLPAWLRSDPAAGDEIFDARLHLTGLGYERIDPVRADALVERPALIDGLPAVPYQTNDGRLAFDLTRLGEGRRLLRLARVDPEASSATRPDDGPVELRLAVTGLHTAGESTLDGVLAYESSSPATLTADATRERAELRFRPAAGDTVSLVARFQDRWSPTGAEVTSTEAGPTIAGLAEPPARAETGPPAKGAENTKTLHTERATAGWTAGRLAVSVEGTADHAADSVALSIRGRSAGLEIPVAGDGRVTDGRFEVTGQVDPTVLAEDIWDLRIGARSATGKQAAERKQRDPVRIGKLTEQPAVVDGRGMVAYVTKDGGLALDLTETARTVVGAARVEPAEVSEADGEVVIGLPRVHVHGAGRIDGRAVTDSELPARLIGSDDGAVIVAGVPDPAARRDLRFAFAGNRSSRRLAIEYADETATVLVSGQPAATVTLAGPAAPSVGSPRTGEPAPAGLGARLRRGLGSVLKRRGGVDDSS